MAAPLLLDYPVVATMRTDHATVHALRHALEAETINQPIATRWRILDCERGAIVIDDGAQTCTVYEVA